MHIAHLLADGIPPGLIFFGAFVFLWIVATVFGKAKSAPPAGRGQSVAQANERWQTGQQSRQQQWQAKLEQLAGSVVNAPPPPPMPRTIPTTVARTASAKPRSRGTSKQQPVTVQQAAQLARQAAAKVQTFVAKPTAKPTTAATSASRSSSSETARNLRLMLQRGGVREAVLLSEILNAPLSLRNDPNAHG